MNTFERAVKDELVVYDESVKGFRKHRHPRHCISRETLCHLFFETFPLHNAIKDIVCETALHHKSQESTQAAGAGDKQQNRKRMETRIRHDSHDASMHADQRAPSPSFRQVLRIQEPAFIAVRSGQLRRKRFLE